ncbi:hypothetical protein [Prevotella sp. HUN102]|uniref:hypothetical protein n=1 Tax=Prevotella sp. HUN102 TaxID=1392486 RepID=UPI00048F3929|nr:hypothetical protein [Prevotella sp. HUN102]
MEVIEQTQQQVERFLRKVAQKFPNSEETDLMTDIHLRVSQDSGDLMAFDDDGTEITRCVVDEWIENKNDNFNELVTAFLRQDMIRLKDVVDNLGIMKPYSFVLEDEEGENIAELYLADDDTIIISDELLPGLDEELDDFLKHLID